MFISSVNAFVTIIRVVLTHSCKSVVYSCQPLPSSQNSSVFLLGHSYWLGSVEEFFFFFFGMSTFDSFVFLLMHYLKANSIPRDTRSTLRCFDRLINLVIYDKYYLLQCVAGLWSKQYLPVKSYQIQEDTDQISVMQTALSSSCTLKNRISQSLRLPGWWTNKIIS